MKRNHLAQIERLTQAVRRHERQRTVDRQNDPAIVELLERLGAQGFAEVLRQVNGKTRGLPRDQVLA